MQDELISELKQQISEGNAVFIVGAGVSIGASRNHPCASWTGLLHNGVDRCVAVRGLRKELADMLHVQIDSGDLDLLLATAEAVSSKLGAPDGIEYSTWLRETAGSLTPLHRETIEALYGLGCVLATTNYDGLIEKVTGLDAVTWMERGQVSRVVRGDDEGVLHLHGFWKKPESVVLGARSYERVSGDQYAQAMLRALQILKTLVFVGTGEGLSDPNFGALLEWTTDVLPQDEYRRFRLCLDGEVEALTKRHPLEQRLFPVGIGKDHGALAGFLRSLGSNQSRRSSASAAAASARVTGTTFLPAAPRCFGRDEEMADLVANLLAEKPLPAPILGPPGIGKSTLTLAAMHDPRVSSRYGERRWFIRCDGLRSRSELAAEIARAAGLQLAPNIESAVLHALAAAPAVLALDNLETPWEADTLQVEEFIALLADASSGEHALALIASLRGSQRPAGVTWREPLLPQPLKLPAARDAFLAIAGKGLEADPRLDELLNGVDCVPIAITLLAHQAEGEPTLETLYQRWQRERTAMLQRADARDRLTNIELSYELSLHGPRMTDGARQVLSMLALLPNGLALTDVGEIMPDGGDAAAMTARKAGLIQDEAGRVRLLAPLREYLRRKYQAENSDRDRLVAHFVELASELAGKVGRTGGAEAVKRLMPEAANVESLNLMGLDGAPASAAIEAAIAWSEFVRFTGVGSEAPVEKAATVARGENDLLGCARCTERLGDIALHRSDHETAKRRYEEAQPLYRQVGSVIGEANCIRSLGDIALERSDHETAKRRYEEALPLYRQVGSVLGEANCIWRLGDIALRRSDHETAKRRYEEALPLYRRVGDVLGEANCIKTLGDIALERSDHEAAKRRYEESLPLFRQVGSVLGEANCIKKLGNIALARSDPETAKRRYEEAQPLYRQVGDVLGQANCIWSLGDIALQESDHETAKRRYEEALPLYLQVGAVVGEADCIYGLGNVALCRSDHATAKRRYEEAQPLYRQVGYVVGEANCIQGLGDVAVRQSDQAGARKRFEDALALYQRIAEPYSIGRSHRRLARLASDDGERRRHVEATRAAWLSIDRPDLVKGLDEEFGADSVAPPEDSGSPNSS
ncbi:MAG: tetratricopeptide repeat protein [Acidobacteriota bacterium]